mmetsp:Transcript_38166/g.85075  ORF Transcript_38166/g.85075 Transcript_38166/m.85075 type:complete len:371 (+) Transcript_38166:64-1176(+)
MAHDQHTVAQDVFQGLKEVDRLTIINIVDNETDGLSTPCSCCDPRQPGWTGVTSYESEFTSMMKDVVSGRTQEMNIQRSLHAGHGLSLLLVAEAEGVTWSLVLDGGPDPQLWRDNATKLRLNLPQLQAAVLSHWHADHSMGLSAVATWVAEGRAGDMAGGRDVVFDVHPDRPQRRGFRTPDGVVPFNEDVQLSDLELPGCQLSMSAEPHTLLESTFFVSGTIPRVTPYETGLPAGITLRAGETEWQPDPLILDERYVAVKIKGRGIVVFSSCSHAGIVNVCRHVVDISGGLPLLGVVGGLHLSGRDSEPRIKDTVRDLRKLLDPVSGVVLAGHCTGWRAKAALEAGLPPGHFQPLAVGGKYVFQGEGARS